MLGLSAWHLRVNTLSSVKVSDYRSKFGWIVISHNSAVLKQLDPTHIHILQDGKIGKTGNLDLLDAIEQKGFDNVK